MMKFAPEYVTYVLNENFEDAKALLLSPMMAINYAHLVMLASQGIVAAADARVLRSALDTVSQDQVRTVAYDGSCADLFYYVERLVIEACGDDVAGRLHTARSRNDMDMTMYRIYQRELVLGLVAAGARPPRTAFGLGSRPFTSTSSPDVRSAALNASTTSAGMLAAIRARAASSGSASTRSRRPR